MSSGEEDDSQEYEDKRKSYFRTGDDDEEVSVGQTEGFNPSFVSPAHGSQESQSLNEEGYFCYN